VRYVVVFGVGFLAGLLAWDRLLYEPAGSYGWTTIREGGEADG
jgi:hypothetical protein